MKAKAAARKLPDTYFALVRRFPLTHIRDDKHLTTAQAVLDQLLKADLDNGQQEYLAVLTDLIEDYEDRYERTPDASEADVLRELMGSNKLSQAKLAKKSGIAQSTISAVLNGGRALTKEQVLTLAKIFQVSPGAFLPT